MKVEDIYELYEVGDGKRLHIGHESNYTLGYFYSFYGLFTFRGSGRTKLIEVNDDRICKTCMKKYALEVKDE